MRSFGVNVKESQESGALRVLSYEDFFKRGSFSIPETLTLWKTMLKEVTAKGFKGLRVTGEMACFLKRNRVKELVEYEKTLHRVLDLSMTAICAYDSDSVRTDKNQGLFLDLLLAHSSVIVTGPTSGVVGII
jgi:hypothetical protein